MNNIFFFGFICFVLGALGVIALQKYLESFVREPPEYKVLKSRLKSLEDVLNGKEVSPCSKENRG